MTYASTVLADSPLLYWQLDDALASTTAADASGNSRTGTVTAWTFRQTSQFSGSSFGSTPTSTSGKIVSPSIAFGTSQVTVEMWINFAGGAGTYMPFSFGTNYLDLWVTAGKVGVNTNMSDQYGITVPGSGVHHLVVIMPNNQATTNAKIYVDGVLQVLSGTSGTAPSLGTTTFQVSNYSAGGQGIPNGVYIDDVSVYIGALSAFQVATHYRAGVANVLPDLFADAQTITVDSTTLLTTGGFTTEASEPLVCPVAATAWYKLTPAYDGVYQIDTIGSGYDTGLSVYTGTALASLSRVAWDDSSGGSSNARLALELIGGTQYYIQAGAGPSAGTTTGNLQLKVTSPPGYRGWGSGTPAGTIITGSTGNINAGTAFMTLLSGQRCVGARVYVQAGATGDPTGAVAYLYAASGGYPTGSPLATANLPSPLTLGGWTEVRWSPVALTANTVYYVVAYIKNNVWIDLAGAFTSEVLAPSGAPGLVFPVDTGAHHNCAYVYGTPGTVPNATVGANWLGVDVILDSGLITAGWH